MTEGGAGAVGEALAAAGARFAAAAAAALDDLSGLAAPPPTCAVLVAGPRVADACEAAAALLGPAAPVPVVVADGGELPAHVGAGTLVAVCALGPFERRRVATVCDEAAGRGADVVVVGEGGHVGGPEALPPAGAATSPPVTAGLLEVLPALLVLGERAGLGGDGLWVEAAAALSAAAGSLGAVQPALHDRLARRIGRTIPLFEGARGVGAVAARSWRRSWNLLAKAPALATAQPGASFEEIAGFGQHGDVTRQILTLVSLRTEGDLAEDVVRSRLLAELAGEALAGVIEVAAAGDGAAAALAHLEWLGLATAHARALQEGLDPAALPVPVEVEARLTTEATGAG